MAEMNQNGRGEFFESDPFAELTRIIGNSPAGTKPSDPFANAEDDLSLDLERELMGELDASQFDLEAETVAQPQHEVLAEPAAAYDEVQPASYQPEDEFAADFGDLESALENEMYSQFEGAIEESMAAEVEQRFDTPVEMYAEPDNQVASGNEAPSFYTESAAPADESVIADFDFSELEAELDTFAAELPAQDDWQAVPASYDQTPSIGEVVAEQRQDDVSFANEPAIDFSEFEAELAAVEAAAPQDDWQVEEPSVNEPVHYEVAATEEVFSAAEREDSVVPADENSDFDDLEAELSTVLNDAAPDAEMWSLNDETHENVSEPELLTEFSEEEILTEPEAVMVQEPQNFDFSELEAELAALDNRVPQASSWPSEDVVLEQTQEADVFEAGNLAVEPEVANQETLPEPDFDFSDFEAELTAQENTDIVSEWQEPAIPEFAQEEVSPVIEEPSVTLVEEPTIEQAPQIDFSVLRAQLADFNGTPEAEEAPVAINWWDQPVEATQEAVAASGEVSDLPEAGFDVLDDAQSVAPEVEAAFEFTAEDNTDATPWDVEAIVELAPVQTDDYAEDVELDFDFLDAELTVDATDTAAIEPSFDETSSAIAVAGAAAAAAAATAYASRSTNNEVSPANEFGRANFSTPAQRPQASYSDRSKIIFSGGAASSAFSNGVSFKAPERSIESNAQQDEYATQAAPAVYDEPTQAYAPDDSGVPDIETIDFSDTATPVFNDLDIPEIDYEPSTAKPLNDFESEFSQVFGDNLTADQGSSFASSTDAKQPDSDASSSGSDAYSLDDWQARGGFENSKYDFENELERSLAVDAYEDESDVAKKEPLKRSTLIAAVIAGVAIVGGIGTFGMSFFGGTGSDGPVLIRADNEPMRVRPENPGGSNVPNQNNQVYQRIGGNQGDSTPGQERLVTTAEQPVDVLARAQEPNALPPGVSDSSLAGLSGDIAGQPKSEDRLAPAQPSSSATPEEVGAVAPRRVRTMIVRPDGTMVPREEVAAAPALAPANTVNGGQQNVPSLEEATTLVAPSATEEGGPVVATPATVAVVPTPRPAVVAPAQPQAQPVAAPQAAAPAQAAATPAQGATSLWSMQIASQPTAEGAQTAYQDLARRYSSVLQGRGVNIVSANIEGRGTFYRVRIPAQTREEAVQLCTRYQAAGGSCFVSR